jgi:hypothetical protein
MLVIALLVKVYNYRENECNICNIFSPQIYKFLFHVCTRVNVLHIGVICFSTDCTSQVIPFFVHNMPAMYWTRANIRHMLLVHCSQ